MPTPSLRWKSPTTTHGAGGRFETAGFELYDAVPQPVGARARVNHDLVIRAERHLGGLAGE